MQKKITVMALAAIVALVSAMPVAAQLTASDVGTLSSNTKTSTADIFTNDVDNFINYHKYSTVLTDDAKWFGFVTGRTNFGVLADLGFATNIGSLYLGIWYRGNIVRQNVNDTESHTITPVWDDALEILTESKETTRYSASKWLDSANKFEFLVGVAGHGIKVGFYESYTVDQNPAAAGRDIDITDYQDGRKDYANATVDYQNSNGFLRPYIGWGSNFAIGDMNLMPYVDFAFQIKEDKLVDNYESYTEVNGARQGVSSNFGNGRNNGVLTPIIQVGAKLDLAKKNTTVSQLELKYNLELDVYSNDYDVNGFSGTTPGTVRWDNVSNTETQYADRTVTLNGITLYFNEQTRIHNSITPTYKITGEPFENFKLGFSAQVPVFFRSSSSNQYRKTLNKNTTTFNWNRPGEVTETETTYYDPNSNFEISTFGLTLNFNLGASYKLKPDRFIINAGIKATPLSYSRTETTRLPNSVASISTTKTTQDDGSVTTNTKTVTPKTEADSVSVEDTWNPWSAGLYGGFVFYFSPKAALDLCMSASVGDTGFNFDLTQLNVIFTFKF